MQHHAFISAAERHWFGGEISQRLLERRQPVVLNQERAPATGVGLFLLEIALVTEVFLLAAGVRRVVGFVVKLAHPDFDGLGFLEVGLHLALARDDFRLDLEAFTESFLGAHKLKRNRFIH